MAEPRKDANGLEAASQIGLAAVGTSGFSYRDWKGVLYPEWLPTRDWFHYYATRFATVEINLTFYRPPMAKMLERWRTSAPPRFAFVLKASRVITHERRLLGCGDDLERMAASYQPLGEQLACVLFQLPPSLRQDHARLEPFLAATAVHFERASLAPRLAIEFRHPSWNTRRTLDLLLRHGCGLVFHDMEDAGGWHWRDGRLTAGELSLGVAELCALPSPLLYLRFHGTTGKYAGEYGQERLEPWAHLARSGAARQIPVHAYFNNTQAGAAVRDALKLGEMLGREGSTPHQL